jgi:hypothetical protein
VSPVQLGLGDRIVGTGAPKRALPASSAVRPFVPLGTSGGDIPQISPSNTSASAGTVTGLFRHAAFCSSSRTINFGTGTN